MCLLIGLAACGGLTHPTGSTGAGEPPAFALGEFEDDYGEHYTITATEWKQHPSSTYRVVEWNRAGRFLIAQNGPRNWADANLWTRIDWVKLDNMAPYTWAFCMAAYKEPTEDAARSVTIAHPESPKTGCNGFPYSRMKATGH